MTFRPKMQGASLEMTPQPGACASTALTALICHRRSRAWGGTPPSYEAHRGYQLDLRPGNASGRIDGANGGHASPRVVRATHWRAVHRTCSTTAPGKKTPWSPIYRQHPRNM